MTGRTPIHPGAILRGEIDISTAELVLRIRQAKATLEAELAGRRAMAASLDPDSIASCRIMPTG